MLDPVDLRPYYRRVMSCLWRVFKKHLWINWINMSACISSSVATFVLVATGMTQASQSWIRILAEVWPLALLFVYFLVLLIRAPWKINNEDRLAYNAELEKQSKAHNTELDKQAARFTTDIESLSASHTIRIQELSDTIVKRAGEISSLQLSLEESKSSLEEAKVQLREERLKLSGPDFMLTIDGTQASLENVGKEVATNVSLDWDFNSFNCWLDVTPSIIPFMGLGVRNTCAVDVTVKGQSGTNQTLPLGLFTAREDGQSIELYVDFQLLTGIYLRRTFEIICRDGVTVNCYPTSLEIRE